MNETGIEETRLFLAKMSEKLPIMADCLDWYDLQVKNGAITQPQISISGDEVQSDLRILANILSIVVEKEGKLTKE